MTALSSAPRLPPFPAAGTGFPAAGTGFPAAGTGVPAAPRSDFGPGVRLAQAVLTRSGGTGTSEAYGRIVPFTRAIRPGTSGAPAAPPPGAAPGGTYTRFLTPGGTPGYSYVAPGGSAGSDPAYWQAVDLTYQAIFRNDPGASVGGVTRQDFVDWRTLSRGNGEGMSPNQVAAFARLQRRIEEGLTGPPPTAAPSASPPPEAPGAAAWPEPAPYVPPPPPPSPAQIPAYVDAVAPSLGYDNLPLGGRKPVFVGSTAAEAQREVQRRNGVDAGTIAVRTEGMPVTVIDDQGRTARRTVYPVYAVPSEGAVAFVERQQANGVVSPDWQQATGLSQRSVEGRAAAQRRLMAPPSPPSPSTSTPIVARPGSDAPTVLPGPPAGVTWTRADAVTHHYWGTDARGTVFSAYVGVAGLPDLYDRGGIVPDYAAPLAPADLPEVLRPRGPAPGAPRAPRGAPPSLSTAPGSPFEKAQEALERYRERRRAFPAESEDVAREQALGDLAGADRAFAEQAIDHHRRGGALTPGGSSSTAAGSAGGGAGGTGARPPGTAAPGSPPPETARPTTLVPGWPFSLDAPPPSTIADPLGTGRVRSDAPALPGASAPAAPGRADPASAPPALREAAREGRVRDVSGMSAAELARAYPRALSGTMRASEDGRTVVFMPRAGGRWELTLPFDPRAFDAGTRTDAYERLPAIQRYMHGIPAGAEPSLWEALHAQKINTGYVLSPVEWIYDADLVLTGRAAPGAAPGRAPTLRLHDAHPLFGDSNSHREYGLFALLSTELSNRLSPHDLGRDPPDYAGNLDVYLRAYGEKVRPQGIEQNIGPVDPLAGDDPLVSETAHLDSVRDLALAHERETDPARRRELGARLEAAQADAYARTLSPGALREGYLAWAAADGLSGLGAASAASAARRLAPEALVDALWAPLPSREAVRAGAERLGREPALSPERFREAWDRHVRPKLPEVVLRAIEARERGGGRGAALP